MICKTSYSGRGFLFQTHLVSASLLMGPSLHFSPQPYGATFPFLRHGMFSVSSESSYRTTFLASYPPDFSASFGSEHAYGQGIQVTFPDLSSSRCDVPALCFCNTLFYLLQHLLCFIEIIIFYYFPFLLGHKLL